MNKPRSTLRKETRNALLDDLTRTRRRVVAALLDRSSATERELAAELAGSEREDSTGGISREEARIRLRHVDLPKLADAGLVEWDRAEATVTAADHPAFEDDRFRRVVEGHGVASALDARQRTVLAVLDDRDGPQGRADLAREVAARESPGEPSAEAVDRARRKLHHVDLPKLDRAGLVEYNADDGVVSRRDPRTLQ